ncbi:RcnB family protein (plasmid) [Acinetobacter haemolyticus]|uniref:RcnB family protein n=1 Tax=Acinetobacter sp. ANC 4218 TaxID=1977880 RepID=UPI000A338A77|nr:RcnB family protein [Acinetobacter sp. ANC 4218]OTG74719.1 hypothetical protein B9T38_00330 [Acinetobacter sp. ANC 4218]UDM39785.1 RcnB family protein [Acinetobacter haemolyticus]GIT84709.1 hypothetical protein DSM16313_24910 [Acinetobacter seohaensis]
MKKLVQASFFTFSTAIFISPVIAAPQERLHNNSYNQAYMHSPAANQSQQQMQQRHQQQMQQETQQQMPQRNQQEIRQEVQQRHREIVQNQILKPSRDWKPGQALPSRYYGQGYRFDYRMNKKLSKPEKNQQWIRVHGDYILINTVNHRILKVVPD